MNRKGSELLQENVIFIVLNVVFFTVMLLFIYLQSSSVHILEQETAKRIALMIDVAKPGTIIELNLDKLMSKAEKDKVNRNSVVQIDNKNNVIVVRGSKDSYYEYGYFNDVYVSYTFKGDHLRMNILAKDGVKDG